MSNYETADYDDIYGAEDYIGGKQLELTHDPLGMTAYIIHPVRLATDEDLDFAEEYAAWLEEEGYEVFLPGQDNPYEDVDETGRDICLCNLAAIMWADEVHVIWKEGSTGSAFDLGMAFAEEKPLVLVFPKPDSVSGQSFSKLQSVWPWGVWVIGKMDGKFFRSPLRFPIGKVNHFGPDSLL